MLFLHEYRPRGRRLSDHLPWAALIGPGVVLNKDGGFQRTLAFRGPDLSAATDAELRANRARLNNALRRLGSGWCVHVEARREAAAVYPPSRFPEPVSALVEAERRRAAVGRGQRFESRHFVTLSFLPPPDQVGRAAEIFREAAEPAPAYARALEAFHAGVEAFADLLAGFLPEVALLGDGETLSYLHSCVSTSDLEVAAPETPAYLDAILTDDDFVGGLSPRLGAEALRIVSVRAFPDTSAPALLDDLNDLGFAYRWVSRYLPLDKERARRTLAAVRRKWFSQRKGAFGLLVEALTREPTRLEDADALAKAADAEAALGILGADAAGFGHFTPTVTVRHPREDQAGEMAREIVSRLNRRGLVAKIETVNAVEAWLGSLPGHAYADVRRPLVSTLNLADMLPASAVWAGPRRNAHLTLRLGGSPQPPLLHARAAGSTPFRLDLHQGDVGHTLVVGPTGSGKSVLLNMLGLQWLRYPGARVIAFDRGGSGRMPTILCGGEWIDLDPFAATLALQPLTGIEEAGARAFAHAWILELVAGPCFTPGPAAEREIGSALASLVPVPPERRTLSLFAAAVQDAEVKAALRPFIAGGPYEGLFGSAARDLGPCRWRTFEIGGLMAAPVAAGPALAMLFRRLERGFDGAPTLLLLDEAWLYLRDSRFSAKLREWLKTLRKANVSVVFATQSLDDVLSSDLASAVIESCPTKIFLPNPEAESPQAAAAYAQIGLTERQRRILAEATPKRHYFYRSPSGCRLFELDLGPIALAIAAAPPGPLAGCEPGEPAPSLDAFLRARGLAAPGADDPAPPFRDQAIKERSA